MSHTDTSILISSVGEEKSVFDVDAQVLHQAVGFDGAGATAGIDVGAKPATGNFELQKRLITRGLHPVS